jgi:transmembrane sensor
MNTTNSGITPDDERRRQACQWYLEHRLESKLPRVLERRWRKWADDPANLAAYRDFARLHSMLLSLPPPSLPSDAELHADSSDMDLDTHGDPTPNPTPETRLARPGRPLTWGRVGSAAAAIIVLAWVLFRISSQLDITPEQTQVYVTPPGVPSNFTLPDRSIVTLSGSARLTATFSKHRRQLLLTEGEAFFKVKHDPAVPFQVQAGSARIVDAGTTFNVRRYSDGVVVSVAEGEVTVIPNTPANAADTSVKGGEQVTYDARGEVSRPRVTALEAITSWLSGRRIYHGESLSKVIEDVQLYVPQHIDLDGALETVRFSGSIDQLDSRQAEQWVRGLRNIYPVDVEVNAHRMLIRCSLPGCPGIHR